MRNIDRSPKNAGICLLHTPPFLGHLGMDLKPKRRGGRLGGLAVRLPIDIIP